MSALVTQTENAAQATGAAYETSAARKKQANYGRTIGTPELSEEGQKYYEELKKKFSNMDFILVSSDMKQAARAQAGSYANPHKLVVLVDEEKIERMATDENFRKQYEAVISNAAVRIPQLKASLGSNASKVKGFGMQVNDGGNASFFAVVDKSLAAQRDRIRKSGERKAQQKAAEKKTAEKKEARKAAEEKQAEKAASEEDLVTVTASSIEELINKINDVVYGSMSDSIWSDSERLVGQHVDFKW